MSTKKPTILIVDDMPVNIQILSGVLSSEYTLKAATCGQKALDIVRSDKSVDLIILDVVMPDMDGYQVCQALKNDPSTNKIPIIFVTAKSDVSDEERAFNLGAVDYIVKPYHPVIVKARVRNQINLNLKSKLLEDLAQIDALTQIYNRRYLNNELPLIFNNCKEMQQPFAIAMIDVDYFKNYNDNYGHGMGDICLINIAKAINNCVDAQNGVLLARYGGEEFVLVLPAIRKPQIEVFLQSILLAVEDLRILHEFSQVNNVVTVSIGVKYLDSLDSFGNYEEILRQADKALYHAKGNGRNQVCVR